MVRSFYVEFLLFVDKIGVFTISPCLIERFVRSHKECFKSLGFLCCKSCTNSTVTRNIYKAMNDNCAERAEKKGLQIRDLSVWDTEYESRAKALFRFILIVN